MKAAILSLALLASSSAHAEDLIRTQDNINYIVTFTEDSDWQGCGRIVCALAQGYGVEGCQIWEDFGIALVNVTTNRAEEIAKLSCVMEVRPEGVMTINPRFGRGN